MRLPTPGRTSRSGEGGRISIAKAVGRALTSALALGLMFGTVATAFAAEAAGFLAAHGLAAGIAVVGAVGAVAARHAIRDVVHGGPVGPAPGGYQSYGLLDVLGGLAKAGLGAALSFGLVRAGLAGAAGEVGVWVGQAATYVAGGLVAAAAAVAVGIPVVQAAARRVADWSSRGFNRTTGGRTVFGGIRSVVSTLGRMVGWGRGARDVSTTPSHPNKWSYTPGSYRPPREATTVTLLDGRAVQERAAIALGPGTRTLVELAASNPRPDVAVPEPHPVPAVVDLSGVVTRAQLGPLPVEGGFTASQAAYALLTHANRALVFAALDAANPPAVEAAPKPAALPAPEPQASPTGRLNTGFSTQALGRMNYTARRTEARRAALGLTVVAKPVAPPPAGEPESVHVTRAPSLPPAQPSEFYAQRIGKLTEVTRARRSHFAHTELPAEVAAEPSPPSPDAWAENLGQMKQTAARARAWNDTWYASQRQTGDNEATAVIPRTVGAPEPVTAVIPGADAVDSVSSVLGSSGALGA